MKNSKNGFTLAEVLVTLAIIGVVAALTIPSLMQNTNSTKYTTALKKNISVLNSALKNNIANNDRDASDPSITGSASLAAWFVTGNANGVAGTTTPTNLNVLRWVAADPTSVWLSDGTRLRFYYKIGTGCPVITPINFSQNNCYVIIDTNGDRKPNTVATNADAGASDLWALGISPNGVFPIILGIAQNLGPLPTTDVNGGVLSPAYSPTIVSGGNRASYAALTGAT